jgi:hypothetical protein
VRRVDAARASHSRGLMRLPLALLPVLGLPALVACANGGGDNAAAPMDSGGGFDVVVHDTGADVPAHHDVYIPDQYIPPSDGPTGFDTGHPDTGGGDGAGADGGPNTGCLATGQPCNTQAPLGCPFFFFCNAAFDAGQGDSGNDGVCPFGPTNHTACNDGIDQCSAGEACLMASMLCLTSAETPCVCNSPAFRGACGPPWYPDGGGPEGGADAAPDAPPDGGPPSDGGGD